MRPENERMTVTKFKSHLIALFAELKEMPTCDRIDALQYARKMSSHAFVDLLYDTGRADSGEMGKLKKSIDMEDV